MESRNEHEGNEVIAEMEAASPTRRRLLQLSMTAAVGAAALSSRQGHAQDIDVVTVDITLDNPHNSTSGNFMVGGECGELRPEGVFDYYVKDGVMYVERLETKSDTKTAGTQYMTSGNGVLSGRFDDNKKLWELRGQVAYSDDYNNGRTLEAHMFITLNDRDELTRFGVSASGVVDNARGIPMTTAVYQAESAE